MAPTIVHLPNGQTLTVTPVFGGVYFKSNELNTHHSAFPAGWTIIIHAEDDEEDHDVSAGRGRPSPSASDGIYGNLRKQSHVHRYRKPTLNNDHLFISSISNPSSSEFKPATSPTRQIAMMLWASLWWYFHQQEPDPHVTTEASKNTAEAGRPKADWRIHINREGIFKSRNLLPKLERMGLITSEDSSVGTDYNHIGVNTWADMFVPRRSFWQLDARLYLFTLSPVLNSPFPSSSPFPSRPSSPTRHEGTSSPRGGAGFSGDGAPLGEAVAQHLVSKAGTPTPFQSSSHLPTYYPPSPAQYVFSNNIRHPIRPKPPRQGETFYTRYIPSLEQYLTFRVASLSPKPLQQVGGPIGGIVPPPQTSSGHRTPTTSASDSLVPTMATLNLGPSDVDLLHRWMNNPRVNHFWGEAGDHAHQEAFLTRGLQSRHSIPVIGCFDGRPFGYFEIYWVKEDPLGKHLGGIVGDWERGIHFLVGEEEFRGAHRVRVWLSALVHWCWLTESRTDVVVCEPRVDNVKLRNYLEEVGFYKEREVTFPHKQSNLMKIRREAWEQPAL